MRERAISFKEALNEAAFEAVGEPVCEGSDPIDINSYAVKEMLP